MEHLEPEEVQELEASRSYNVDRENIEGIESSPASDILEGEIVTRKQLALEFDKGEGQIFPWGDIQNLLDDEFPYDLPVRHIVLQFESEEFEEEWIDKIDKAIDQEFVQTDWIESPFYAVLESSKPQDGDARRNVQDHHQEFYFKPKFAVDEDYEGMDWQVRTLDLRNVWSHQAFIERQEDIFTQRFGENHVGWDPRSIEKYVMNYFSPEQDYTGVIRNPDFAGLWRRTFSRDVTAPKIFQWEEGEEWAIAEAE